MEALVDRLIPPEPDTPGGREAGCAVFIDRQLAIDPASIIRVILRGARSVSTQAAPTGPGMPSFAATLDDAQVAAVATYVRNACGNAAPAVTPGRVAADRASLADRPAG